MLLQLRNMFLRLTVECPNVAEMNDVIDSIQPYTVLKVTTPDGTAIEKVELPPTDKPFVMVVNEDGTVVTKVC